MGTSNGAFNVQANTSLEFNSGTHELNTTSSITGTGGVHISGGTVNFNSGTYDIDGGTDITGGTINFNSAADTVGGSLRRSRTQAHREFRW